jgi:D-alanyl-lipoteichoic acid acyltransferase DltB (MBOAT superfamily)
MAFVPIYIVILFATIVIDYFAGIMIEKSQGRRRKLFLIASIVANVGVLAVFKYYNFFADNINELLNSLHITTTTVPLLKILLPIGLSFHTFQAMSYTFEVYRGNQKAERRFGIYALYVMFYPQLVAGPIERPQNVLHQFHEKKFFNYDNAVSGLRLMMWGMFKKVVIADRLTELTDPVFNHPHNYPPITLVLATIFFTFQIYCDFSGYSDIALGSARVMGFKLMKNFDRPYSSKSISEFWGRWHISLSTWFRDYLYISLGGNRVSVPRWIFNLFFVFLVSGFWHGANWTFIVWGALHGFYSIASILIQRAKGKFIGRSSVNSNSSLQNALNIGITFTLVSVAWVFFRSNTISDAVYIIGKFPFVFNDIAHIVKTRDVEFMNIWNIYEFMSIKRVLFAFLLIFLMEFVQYAQQKYNIVKMFYERPIYLRWALYYTVIYVIITFGVFKDHQFIYFQF